MRMRVHSFLVCVLLLGTLVSAQEAPTAEEQSATTSATSAEPANLGLIASASAGPLATPEPAIVSAPSAVAPVMITRQPETRKSNDSRNKKIWYSLVGVNHATAAFDAWSTRDSIQRGARELNPLLKPFASSNAMYAANQVVPFGMDYLGRRMMHSNNSVVRKLWWVPQTASAACALAAGVHNMGVGQR
jgi:hypothetical protein